jgi:FkbM family methyltransferase
MATHFFDIGANNGNTFEYFLNGRADLHGSTVWCFEPSPKQFQSLIAVATEATKNYTIRICPFGLSGKTETLRFYEKIFQGGLGDSFFDKYAYGTPRPNPEYLVIASTVSISEFMARHIPPEDKIILKVDCEGAEYAIYDDLLARPHLLKQVTQIYNEWHPHWDDMDTEQRASVTRITTGLSAHGLTLETWPF